MQFHRKGLESSRSVPDLVKQKPSLLKKTRFRGKSTDTNNNTTPLTYQSSDMGTASSEHVETGYNRGHRRRVLEKLLSPFRKANQEKNHTKIDHSSETIYVRQPVSPSSWRKFALLKNRTSNDATKSIVVNKPHANIAETDTSLRIKASRKLSDTESSKDLGASESTLANSTDQFTVKVLPPTPPITQSRRGSHFSSNKSLCEIPPRRSSKSAWSVTTSVETRALEDEATNAEQPRVKQGRVSSGDNILDPISSTDGLVPIAIQPEHMAKPKERGLSYRDRTLASSVPNINGLYNLQSSHASRKLYRSNDSLAASRGGTRAFSVGARRTLRTSRTPVYGSNLCLSQEFPDSFDGRPSPHGSLGRSSIKNLFSSLQKTLFASSSLSNSSSIDSLFYFSRKQTRSTDDVFATEPQSSNNDYLASQPSTFRPSTAPSPVAPPPTSTYASQAQYTLKHVTNMKYLAARRRSKSVDVLPCRRTISPHQVVQTSTIYVRSDAPETIQGPHGQENTQGKVNQYVILRDIGSGAYGRVVLVRNETDGRYYACKIISKSRLKKKFRWRGLRPIHGNVPACSNISGFETDVAAPISGIMREVAILKKLSKHPNINALIEVLDDQKEDNLYMIFELCEYGPVMSIKCGERVRPFTEDLARMYFRDIVLGLEYLHYKRIIHRDLKPENLLLTADHHVQIADFGISHMFNENDDEAVISDKNASPLYCPPEACDTKTKGLKGRAVDIWCLGVTLYCFVHGRCPHEDFNVLNLYEKILTEEPQISNKISPGLRDLLSRMLKKDPDQRVTLSEIKEHPWVTVNDTWPMMSTAENCVFEDVTNEEVETAVRPAIMFISKIISKLKRGTKHPRHKSDQKSDARGDIQEFDSRNRPMRPSLLGENRRNFISISEESTYHDTHLRAFTPTPT